MIHSEQNLNKFTLSNIGRPLVSTYHARIIITGLHALCARVRTVEPPGKRPIFSLFYARTLLLLGSYYYYYYHLRSTCMYICKVLCIYIQVSRKGEERS